MRLVSEHFTGPFAASPVRQGLPHAGARGAGRRQLGAGNCAARPGRSTPVAEVQLSTGTLLASKTRSSHMLPAAESGRSL